MKKFILKYLFLSFSVFLIIPACVKDMEIDVPETDKEVIVNCLFNPQNKWELTLSETKSIQENDDIYIEDANVEIIAETGEIITLDYSGNKGEYKSDEYPELGKSYTLKVNIPGHNEITAESTIPDIIKANVPDFEIKWVKYLFPNDLTDYDVFPITINFEKQLINSPIIFRALRFNPNYGYKRYLLSSTALQKLERIGIPSIAVEKLEKLTGKWQISTEVFYDCFKGTGTNVEEFNYLNLLVPELKEKTVKLREYDAFYRTDSFANDEWLNNISIDSRTILGIGEFVEKADLFFADQNLKYLMESGNYNDNDKREYWVEVAQCSLDYYEYYRTYILQVSQRINPYSEPVMVHSNINNATGIFAGYNRQMIHLFTF